MQAVVPAPLPALVLAPPSGRGREPTPSSSSRRRRPWYARFRPARRLLRAVRGVASQPQWRVQGHYSVSKLDAYQAFCRATPRRRVLAEVLAAPLPSLGVNLLLEAIPLADPALGWRHAAPFFARMFLSAMISSMPPFAVKSEYIPEFPVRSWRQIALQALAQALAALGACVAVVSASGLFPFPLLQFVPIVPMTLTGRLLGFRARFEDRPDALKRQRGVDALITLEQLPIVIYPMVAAVFMVVSPTLQLWLSATLPVLKLGVRSMLAWAGRADTDLLGVITCAAGHLYHVLFVAMCLQNSKSWETMAVVTAFNVAQMLFNAHEITEVAARVRHSWDQAAGGSASRADAGSFKLGRSRAPPSHCPDDWVAAALGLAADVNVAAALHTMAPSVFVSTYARYRRPEFVARHQAILALEPPLSRLSRRSQRSVVSGLSSRTATSASSSSRKQSWYRRPTLSVQVRPASLQPPTWRGRVVRVRSSAGSCGRGRAASGALDLLTAQEKLQRAFVLELCAALHQTEMIVLRSYTTISMLLFYVAYLGVVFWLPNRRFLITMEPMSTLEAVGATIYRLLSLCALEGAFLAVYLALLRSRLGMRGTDQLAFVLSSQRVLFQAKCVALPIIILGFPLVHHGNGSILRFGSNDHDGGGERGS